jgi:hypothetical protein
VINLSNMEAAPNEKDSLLYEELFPRDSMQNKFSVDDSSKTYFRMPSKYYLCCAGIFILLSIMLPVTFLVIIPEYVQNFVDKTDIVIYSVNMIHPSDEGFDSSVQLSFSQNGPIKSTVHMKKIHVSSDDVSSEDSFLYFINSNSLSVSTSRSKLTSTAVITNEVLATEFTTYAVHNQLFQWHLSGTATVTALYPMDVTFDKFVSLAGYNNFSLFDPLLSGLNTTYGDTNTLYLEAFTTLTSQSDINMIFGQDLSFKIKTEDGVNVGVSTIENCAMYSGEHTYKVNIAMSYSNDLEKAAVMGLLSNYMMGIDAPVHIYSFFLARPISWLSPGLAAIEMHSSIPAIHANLLTEIHMSVSLKNLIHVPFTLTMYNAIDSDVTVTGMVGNIYYKGIHVASVDTSDLHVYIPSKASVVTPSITATSDMDQKSTLLDLINNKGGLVDVYSTTTVYIDAFRGDFVYNQMQVQLYID